MLTKCTIKLPLVVLLLLELYTVIHYRSSSLCSMLCTILYWMLKYVLVYVYVQLK